MFRIISCLLICFTTVLAQDFSGAYTQQDDPSTTLELIANAQGYEGTLLNSGTTAFRVEAQTDEGMLFGFIMLTEANLEQDLFFGAELVGEQLNLTTAFMTVTGQIDESTLTEYVFVRSATSVGTATPLNQAETLNSPLAPKTGANPTNPLGQTGSAGQAASPTAPLASMTGGTAIQADQVYQAGTSLSSAFTGVSFSMPEGFQGGYDSNEEAFFIVAQDQTKLLALEAVSNATAVQLGQATLQTIADSLDENAQIQELLAPQQQGDSFSASYSINGTVLYAFAKQGPAGNAVVIVGYGDQTISEIVNAFARTVILSQPQATAQNTQLGGRDFFSNKTSSYYSPGGVGDGSFASGTERAYTFCSNGAYGFQYSSKSFVSVEGAGSMSSTDSDAHQGNFALSQSLMGDFIILLQANDGRNFVVSVEEVAEGVLIDGFLYDVSQSQQCQ